MPDISDYKSFVLNGRFVKEEVLRLSACLINYLHLVQDHFQVAIKERRGGAR